MTDKPTPDFTAMAAEALDLWQEHLQALASDPKAKDDLAKLMEPSRRLFAEWSEKAQSAFNGATQFTSPNFTTPNAAAGGAPAPAPDGAAAVRPTADDGALRLSQLALRVAELEKRIAKLESAKPRTSRKTAGPAGDK